MREAAPSTAIPPTLGAILAGGQARRLGGGDKALHLIGGRPILRWLIDRLAPRTTRLIVNANDDPARFAAFALPVVPDCLSGHPGPLAGVLSVLDWAALNEPSIEWVVTVPGDTPFPPLDLVPRLHAARRREAVPIACAESAGRRHPIVALWPVTIRHELRRALVERDERRVSDFVRRHRGVAVAWPADPVDPFFNVNTPDDLATADRLAALLEPP